MKEKSLVYLCIRILLGVIFIYHGISKIGNGFSKWINYMNKVGLGFILGIVAIVIEILIGIFLIAGLFTRIASLVGVVFMMIAIYVAHKNDPIIGDKGCSYQLLLLLMCISLCLTGGGNYTLQNLL